MLTLQLAGLIQLVGSLCCSGCVGVICLLFFVLVVLDSCALLLGLVLVWSAHQFTCVCLHSVFE